MSLSNYERETVINYNFGEQTATVWTRDTTVMNKLDKFVAKFPETYKCVESSEYDKKYEFPKKLISFRSPSKGREYTEEEKNVLREKMREMRKKQIQEKENKE